MVYTSITSFRFIFPKGSLSKLTQLSIGWQYGFIGGGPLEYSSIIFFYLAKSPTAIMRSKEHSQKTEVLWFALCYIVTGSGSAAKDVKKKLVASMLD